MIITILGTAAAEGWPAIFCACNACQRARAAGGKNIRSRASIKIGENHKIDFPPDAFYHEAVIGGQMSELRHLFFTHSHQDHFDIKELHYFAPPFAHDNEPALDVWCNPQAAEKLNAMKVAKYPNHGIRVNTIKAFETVKADDLMFTPVPAVHKPDEECFNYVVSDGKHSLLYTCDTGLYEESTWEYLSGIKLDLLISECTNGTKHSSRFHTSFDDVLEMVRRLKEYGTMADSSRVVLTHFSHNGELLHEELEEIATPHGIEIGYDGMVIEL